MSSLESLVDLVVVRLNSAEFSQEFTATKRLYPKFVRPETTGLEVVVVGGPETWTKATRAGVCEVVWNVPVVIRKPVSDPESETGALLTLVEEIKDDLISHTVGAFTPVSLTQSEPFSIEANETEGLFQSIVTMQYKGLK